MATIEKPKTKKTKKTKIVGHHHAKGNFRDVNETTENCVAQQMQTNETLTEELDDFVELTGAAKSSTEIQECFTSTACKNQDQRQDEYENKEDSVQVSLETISSKKGLDNAQLKSGQGSIENPLPSAPLSVESYEPIPAVTVTQYPNLLSLQQHEETPVSEVVYKQPKVRSPGFRLALSELQPFNCEQLRELYYCAELQQVQQFEIEFLNNSLRETYESDPLHVALKTYYQLQSKLTMNIHDVNKFREEATEAQNHIWLKESVTETFSAKCDDNIELKESVTYEIIKVNDKNLKAATAALTVLFDIISDTYTTNLITAKITKLKAR